VAQKPKTEPKAEPKPENDDPARRDPDVRLMLRVKAGDQSAFSQLVTTYQDRLVNVLYHLVLDTELAEDLAQEVFLRIYRVRAGYEPTAKFSTWLFRIANNLAANKRRDKGRHKEAALNVADSGPLGARPAEQLLADKSSLMPGRNLERKEVQHVVQEALDSLNERQRIAVLLHRYEEMSYADIASTLELTPQAVKSLLARARENLRQILEPYVKQGGAMSVKAALADDDG